MLSVYLVEDDDVTALHVLGSFARAGDLDCIGRAATIEGARRELPLLRPQVIVTDIGLPDGEGTELIAAVRSGRCAAPAWWPHVLTYSVHEDVARVLGAIEAGSDDFVLKNGRPQDLLEAVRRIGRGEASISPPIARHVLERARERGSALALDAQDGELLRLVSQGYVIDEVAARLQLSARGVARRVRRMYERLHRSVHAGFEPESASAPASGGAFALPFALR